MTGKCANMLDIFILLDNYSNSSSSNTKIMNNRNVLARSIQISIVLLGWALLLYSGKQAFSQGDLLVTPRRIVFEGNRDRQEITLANTGTDTARYTVSFVQYRMTMEGSFEQITEPDSGQFFADPYLRYFPRIVTLAPKESQVVRMQLRRGLEMQTGEYRSHMYFRAVPEEKPLGEEDIPDDSTAIGVRLIPIFGITIPVIIRVGEQDLTVSLSDLQVEQRESGERWLSLTFHRRGNVSVYGDLTAEHIAPDGTKTEVGVVRGIAVYTPNSQRGFSFKLSEPEGVTLSTGKLVVRYSGTSDTKPVVYSEKELKL